MKKTITFSKTGTSYFKRELKNATFFAFKNLFVTVGATADEENETFSLNGIDNITQDEMLDIYTQKSAVYNMELPQLLQGSSARTILPCMQAVGITLKKRPLSGDRFFADSNIEVVKFGNGQQLDSCDEAELMPSTQMNGTFSGCAALHTVYPINVKDIDNMGSDAFEGCEALREVRLHGLSCPACFSSSPLISYLSLQYMVENSNNTGNINIAVHPQTYRYLHALATAPGDVGGTSNEWEDLHTNATKRNIHFTTTEFIIYVSDNTLCMSNCAVQGASLLIDTEKAGIDNYTLVFK